MLRVLLAAFAVLASQAAATAQNASQAVDRAQLLRTQATLRDERAGRAKGEDSTAPASPNDPDPGDQAILKRAEHYRAFTF